MAFSRCVRATRRAATRTAGAATGASPSREGRSQTGFCATAVVRQAAKKADKRKPTEPPTAARQKTTANTTATTVLSVTTPKATLRRRCAESGGGRCFRAIARAVFGRSQTTAARTAAVPTLTRFGQPLRPARLAKRAAAQKVRRSPNGLIAENGLAAV